MKDKAPNIFPFFKLRVLLQIAFVYDACMTRVNTSFVPKKRFIDISYYPKKYTPLAILKKLG